MCPVAPSYRITTEKSSFKQFLCKVPMMAFCNGVKCRVFMIFDSATAFPFGPKMFLHTFQYPECTHCFQHNQTIIAPNLRTPPLPLTIPLFSTHYDFISPMPKHIFSPCAYLVPSSLMSLGLYHLTNDI